MITTESPYCFCTQVGIDDTRAFIDFRRSNTGVTKIVWIITTNNIVPILIFLN